MRPLSARLSDLSSHPIEGVVSFSVPANSNGSYTFPLAMTRPRHRRCPPAGSYWSSFTSTDFEVFWVDSSTPATCTALAGESRKNSTGTFSVSATVVNQCSVAACSLNFGTASVLSSALSATGAISVTCNAGIPVTIALDNGATGSGPTTRLMIAGRTMCNTEYTKIAPTACPGVPRRGRIPAASADPAGA